MATSTAKATRRAARGLPSKAVRARKKFSGEEYLPHGHRNRRVGTSNEQVSESGRSSRGLAASVSRRVSHASRVREVKPSSSAGVQRKRTQGRKANPRGKFSTPDLGAVFDQESRARANARRNKATARVARIRNQAKGWLRKKKAA